MIGSAASADDVRVPQAARHVLVVDTEIYVCGVVRAALEYTPTYRVTSTSTHSAALRILARDRPDVLLVDMMLSRAPGLPLAMYALSQRVPVVMMTSDRQMARRWARLGCPMLWKPLHITVLHEHLRHAIEGPDENRRRFREALAHVLGNRRELNAVLARSGPLRDQLRAALEAAHDQLAARRAWNR